jgi:hypothetical protein
VGAAPTTTGRAGTARRPGSGKQDEKVYERNQRQSPVSLMPAPTWWIWAGMQRTPLDRKAATPKSVGEMPPRRPWGRTAAYPWRCCRGTVGHLPRRPVGGERGNRRHAPSLKASQVVRWEGAPSADGVVMGRSLRSSPGPGKPAAWRREAARPAARQGTAGGRR